MVLKDVDQDTMRKIAEELFNGSSNRVIKRKQITGSDSAIKIVRQKIENGGVIMDQNGNIFIRDSKNVRKVKVGSEKSDSTIGTDRVERETTKRILEEETRHTKDIAVEVLTQALGLGRFVRDNFESKARFGEFKNVQKYLFETSHFWEVYHELVPKMDQQISMMGEALRNAEYRVNELLKENQQKEYLIREFKGMVEKRA